MKIRVGLLETNATAAIMHEVCHGPAHIWRMSVFPRSIAGVRLNGDVYALRSGQFVWRQGIVSGSMECQTERSEPPIMVPHA